MGDMMSESFIQTFHGHPRKALEALAASEEAPRLLGGEPAARPKPRLPVSFLNFDVPRKNKKVLVARAGTLISALPVRACCGNFKNGIAVE